MRFNTLYEELVSVLVWKTRDPMNQVKIFANGFVFLYSHPEWKLSVCFPLFCFYHTSLETSENQRFCNVFWGYRKRPVAWNGWKNLIKAVHSEAAGGFCKKRLS